MTRRSLRVVVKVPVAEVSAGQSAVVEMTVANGSDHRRPPVLVEDPDGKWSVSHPGLGESSVAGTSQRASLWAPGGAPQAGAKPPPRVGSGARGRGPPGASAPGTEGRFLGRGGSRVPPRFGCHVLDPCAHSDPWAADSRRGGRVVRGPVPPRRPSDHVGASGARDRVPDAGRGGGRRTPSRVASREQRRLAGGGGDRRVVGGRAQRVAPLRTGRPAHALHWPSLARTGELVVREFLEPRAGSLSLLVDLRPSAHTVRSVEAAISRGRPRCPCAGPGPHRRAVHEHGRPCGDPPRQDGPADDAARPGPARSRQRAPGCGPPVGRPAHRGGGLGLGRRTGRRRGPRDHSHGRSAAHAARVLRRQAETVLVP